MYEGRVEELRTGDTGDTGGTALYDYVNNSRLVKEVVVSSAVTSLVLDGLDGVGDGGYVLDIAGVGNGTSSPAYLYVNGDTTGSHYTGQYMSINATSSPNCSNVLPAYVGNSGVDSGFSILVDISVAAGYVTYHGKAGFRNGTDLEYIQDTWSKYSNAVSNLSSLTISATLGVGTTVRLYRKGTAKSEPQKVIYTGVPTAGNLIKEVVVKTATSSVYFDGLNGTEDGGYVVDAQIVNSGTQGDISLFPNRLTTQTDYFTHYIQVSADNSPGVRANANITLFSNQNQNNHGSIDVSCNNGSFEWMARTARHAAIATSAMEEFLTVGTYKGNITNVTSLTLTGPLGVGTIVRLYRKKPKVVYPPSLITTEKVYEKTITLTATGSSITFSGLDGLADGGYDLELAVVGNVNTTAVGLLINGDSLSTNYVSEYSRATGATITANVAGTTNTVTLADATSTTLSYATVSIQVANGQVRFISDAACTLASVEYFFTYSTLYKPTTQVSNITSITLQGYTNGGNVPLANSLKLGTTATLRGRKARTNAISIPVLSNVVEQKVITSDTSVVSFTNLNILKDGRYRLEAEVYNANASSYYGLYFNGDYTSTHYYESYHGAGDTGSHSLNTPIQPDVYSGLRNKSTFLIDIICGQIVTQCQQFAVISATSSNTYNQSGWYVPSVTNLTQIDLKSSVNIFGPGSKITLYKDNYDVPATSPYDVVSAGRLTDLVKEIVLQSAATRVDFDGLDILTDGEYEFTFDINNTSANGVTQLAINGNNTQSFYYNTAAYQNSSASMSTSSTGNNNTLGQGDANSTVTGQGRVSIVGGWPFITGTSRSICSSSHQARTFSMRYEAIVQNITSLSFINSITDSFGAGSVFRLYRKKANNVLALTSRYLNNLIEEKVLTQSSSSVTFTGLNSGVDGDYILEFSLIGSTGTTHGGDCYVNNDSTAGNYSAGAAVSTDGVNAPYSWSTTFPTVGAIDGTAGGLCIGQLKLSVVSGKVIWFGTSYDKRASSKYTVTAGGVYNMSSGIITSLVINFGTGVLAAGSKFTLYKTKGAQKLVPYDPIDITSLSSEYVLRPGECVYKSYTNATTVPLGITTQEGEYELLISGDQTVSAGVASSITLTPNYGGTVPAASSVKHIRDQRGYSGGEAVGAWNIATFAVTATGLLIKSELKISTYTKNKAALSKSSAKDTSGILLMDAQAVWDDTTTPWTSLGLLSFPLAQSGKIIIRRIL